MKGDWHVLVDAREHCIDRENWRRWLNVSSTRAEPRSDLRPRDHVTLVQRSLHWLLIHQRILCILMYGACHGYAADYTTNLVTLTSATSGRSHLRSADSLTFNIPWTRTRIGDRALSVDDPRA